MTHPAAYLPVNIGERTRFEAHGQSFLIGYHSRDTYWLSTDPPGQRRRWGTRRQITRDIAYVFENGVLPPQSGQMWEGRHYRIPPEPPRHFVAPRVVRDFNTLDDLIAHARDELGATHVLVADANTKLYFPRGGQYSYEEASVWRKSGYWHAQGPSARTGVEELPEEVQEIGGGRREGRRAAEARRSPRKGLSHNQVMRIADDLSKKVQGTSPKSVIIADEPGARFKTYSPGGQPVVVFVSTVDDKNIALDVYADERTLDRYENISTFLYGPGGYTSKRVSVDDMAETINEVWKMVDGYAESWQEDGGGELDEPQQRIPDRKPQKFKIGDKVESGYQRKRGTIEKIEWSTTFGNWTYLLAGKAAEYPEWGAGPNGRVWVVESDLRRSSGEGSAHRSPERSPSTRRRAEKTR